MKSEFLIAKQQAIDWLLQNSPNQDVTVNKLQKLLYYAYAWGLVFFNDNDNDLQVKLFDTVYLAGMRGPYDPDIGQKYHDYGISLLSVPQAPVVIDNSDALDLLRQVNHRYGRFNGNFLANLTRHETPWRHARDYQMDQSTLMRPLSDRVIFHFYQDKALAVRDADANDN